VAGRAVAIRYSPFMKESAWRSPFLRKGGQRPFPSRQMARLLRLKRNQGKADGGTVIA
jgi:hypothetical protein